MYYKPTISGKVTQIGYYKDTLPKLIITISKNDADWFNLTEGERKQLFLIINDEVCKAGIRTTQYSKNFIISPDLIDSTGNHLRLTDVLLRNNIKKKTIVELRMSNESIIVRNY